MGFIALNLYGASGITQAARVPRARIQSRSYAHSTDDEDSQIEKSSFKKFVNALYMHSEALVRGNFRSIDVRYMDV